MAFSATPLAVGGGATQQSPRGMPRVTMLYYTIL